ncbi:MAG: Rrf2 family transcriptional regulator [Calditrichaceae bacterium]|nr:Rrf2 family transcriptional regulator [Calditrichaceae bacterium]MBN2707504.1 Rrf2 family transcriptional regulator [Calditrichaceae bacterium]RQV95595.1 MAG: Rrf2 family transcriptional regulator [Calditrichota bacterium]
MLSKKSRYAIIAMVYLAKQFGKGPVLIGQIAEEEKLPKKFLEGILFELKNAGIVNSQRGKNGGYYLIKNPDEVHLAKILRLFDGPIALIPCVTYQYYEPCPECKDEDTCAIRKVFKEIRDVTVEILKKTTLAELIRIEKELMIKK